MENPILYVVLNGELKMSAGKGASQAVHAAMLLQDNFGGNFTSSYKRTVVVLEAQNAEQLKNLHEYLRTADMFSDYYIDEGRNEVDAYSITALVVEPFDELDDEKRAIFEAFPLFGSTDCDKDCDTTNVFKEATRSLEEVVWQYQTYDGIEPHDNAPRYVRKTLKWLKKQRG